MEKNPFNELGEKILDAWNENMKEVSKKYEKVYDTVIEKMKEINFDLWDDSNE